MASSGDEAVAVADGIGYPVLVRPSYVLGGRAMRVCYGADDVRAAMEGTNGRVLVDRFLENAVEIDVDALCDGTDTFVAAVMEHVEEAGVHSGDSSCVLPPQSISARSTQEIGDVVRRHGTEALVGWSGSSTSSSRSWPARSCVIRGQPARREDGAVRVPTR